MCEGSLSASACNEKGCTTKRWSVKTRDENVFKSSTAHSDLDRGVLQAVVSYSTSFDIFFKKYPNVISDISIASNLYICIYCNLFYFKLTMSYGRTCPVVASEHTHIRINIITRVDLCKQKKQGCSYCHVCAF